MVKLPKQEIKYSYDLDFFIKRSQGETYELYNRSTGAPIDMSNIDSKAMSEIIAHAYFYGITTDEKTFYEKIKEAQESYDKEH